MSGESKTHEHENCNIHGQGRINNHSHDHTHDHGHHHDHHHHHGSEAEMMGQDKFDSEEVALAWTTDPLVVFLNNSLHKAIFERFDQNFDPAATTVLDFGCGTGLLTKSLEGKVKQVVGVDVSKAMIKVYNQRGYDNAVGVCEDVVEPFPAQLEGRKFDFIISCYALHHVPDPSKRVQILATYLKPGGHLLFGELEPSKNSPREFFAQGELADWMKAAGLSNVQEAVVFQCKPEDLPESNISKKGEMFKSVILAEGKMIEK